jgi:glucose-6-phosphate 1-dehydrogenase
MQAGCRRGPVGGILLVLRISSKADPVTSQALPLDAFDLVIFGGTGDLARRKLLPALLHRFADGQIVAGSRIVATARDALSTDDYRQRIEAELGPHVAH